MSIITARCWAPTRLYAQRKRQVERRYACPTSQYIKSRQIQFMSFPLVSAPSLSSICCPAVCFTPALSPTFGKQTSTVQLGLFLPQCVSFAFWPRGSLTHPSHPKKKTKNPAVLSTAKVLLLSSTHFYAQTIARPCCATATLRIVFFKSATLFDCTPTFGKRCMAACSLTFW